MNCGSCGSLTIASSPGNLIMAKANLKRRAPHSHLDDSACVTLLAEPDYGTGKLAPGLHASMQIADFWLQQAGFRPGQLMRFAFDYRNRCLAISKCIKLD